MSIFGGVFADYEDADSADHLARSELRARIEELVEENAKLAADNAALAAQLSAQEAVLNAHVDLAHAISDAGFRAYDEMSKLHEIADKLKSRRPE